MVAAGRAGPMRNPPPSCRVRAAKRMNEEKGTEREFLELLDQELASKDINHSDGVGNVCESYQSKMKAMPFSPNQITSDRAGGN